ncbi:MAG TPA: phosphatase PAP2 family protein [Chitinophagaceae bacterium]|nr:phosphatase PAP2 family protein [Chitinophagaceae bacterium]
MKNEKSKQFVREWPLKLLVLLILFLTAGYLFGLIVHEMFGEQDDLLDKKFSAFIKQEVETARITGIMKMITFFASAEFLLIAYVLLVLWFALIKRNGLFALNVSAIAIASFLFSTFLKELFRRARPLDPLIEPLANYSYPSGHASLGFIFYGLLAYLVWRSSIKPSYKYMLAGLSVLFSLLIGFSRIYLRIHYTSDVIAGFCLGIAWLSIVIWFLKKTPGYRDVSPGT